MKDPLQEIMEERARQDKKWGVQNHPNLYWLGILMEEVGEAAKALIEGKLDELYKELIQVSAVGLAWLECMKRRKEHPPCAACDRGDFSLGHSDECIKKKGGAK